MGRDVFKVIFKGGKPFVTLGAGQDTSSSVKLLSDGRGICFNGCLAPPWTIQQQEGGYWQISHGWLVFALNVITEGFFTGVAMELQ